MSRCSLRSGGRPCQHDVFRMGLTEASPPQQQKRRTALHVVCRVLALVVLTAWACFSFGGQKGMLMGALGLTSSLRAGKSSAQLPGLL